MFRTTHCEATLPREKLKEPIVFALLIRPILFIRVLKISASSHSFNVPSVYLPNEQARLLILPAE
ncbi:MAG: hypothetical protein ACPGWR_28175 [Ardenticatenaceae bacterium]